MQDMMKAVVYRGIGNVAVEQVKKPYPERGEVVIKVDSCAICGTDVRIYSYGNDRLTPPTVIGHEVAGTVAMVGEGVENIKVGERYVVFPGIVCGQCHCCKTGNPNLCLNKHAFGYEYDGGFAQYMRVTAEAVEKGNLVPIPENVSMEEAAIAEPLSCAINGQKHLQFRPGQLVAIFGAGPIGLFHMQLALSHGVRVAMVDLSADRLKAARELGDVYCINATQNDPVQELKKLTDGYGADICIICSSVKSILEQCLQCTGKGGSILVFAGMPKQDSFISLDANFVHYKEVSLLGSFASSIDQIKLALQYISEGKINAKRMVTDTIPIDSILEGFDAVRHQRGLKIVVKPQM